MTKKDKEVKGDVEKPIVKKKEISKPEPKVKEPYWKSRGK